MESFEEFIRQFGYWAVLIGTIFEGETALLPTAFAAHQGYLKLHWIIAAAMAGASLADWFYFFLGRRGGKPLLEKYPKWGKRADRVRRLIERYPVGILLIFHFLYGLRAIIPLLYGMSRISAIKFMLLAAASTLMWAVTITAIGYFFGEIAVTYLEVIRQHQWQILLVIVVVGLLIGILVKIEWRHLPKLRKRETKYRSIESSVEVTKRN